MDRAGTHGAKLSSRNITHKDMFGGQRKQEEKRFQIEKEHTLRRRRGKKMDVIYQFRMGVEQKNNLNKFAMAARGDPSVLVESTGLFGLS